MDDGTPSTTCQVLEAGLSQLVQERRRAILKAKLAVQLYGESLVGRWCTCGDVRRPAPMADYYPLPKLLIIEVIKPKEFSIEEQAVAIVTAKEYGDTHEIKEGADLWFDP